MHAWVLSARISCFISFLDLASGLLPILVIQVCLPVKDLGPGLTSPPWKAGLMVRAVSLPSFALVCRREKLLQAEAIRRGFLEEAELRIWEF